MSSNVNIATNYPEGHPHHAKALLAMAKKQPAQSNGQVRLGNEKNNESKSLNKTKC